jgi:hypothetical protein
LVVPSPLPSPGVPGEGERVVGDIIGGEFVNVAEVEMVGAEVGDIHFLFIRIDVVGEDDWPAMLFEGEANEADVGEKFGGA